MRTCFAPLRCVATSSTLILISLWLHLRDIILIRCLMVSYHWLLAKSPRKVTGSRQLLTWHVTAPSYLNPIPSFLFNIAYHHRMMKFRLLVRFFSKLFKTTRKSSIELCSVCSELNLDPRRREEQILGLFDELLLRSHSLGPGRLGCGGCTYFGGVLQSSTYWSDRVSELSGLLVVLTCHGLDTRTIGGSGQCIYPDLLLETCSEEGQMGV